MPTWFQEGKCLSTELWVISAIFSASRLIVVDHLWLQISQRGVGGCAAVVAADDPVSLHPAALAFNLKSGGALTGQRRAIPARTLCLLKHYQSANPVGLAIAVTCPEVRGFNSLKTCTTPPGHAARIAPGAFVATEGMATTAPKAPTTVLGRTVVMRPQPESLLWCSSSAATPESLDCKTGERGTIQRLYQ